MIKIKKVSSIMDVNFIRIIKSIIIEMRSMRINNMVDITGKENFINRIRIKIFNKIGSGTMKNRDNIFGREKRFNIFEEAALYKMINIV